METKTEPPVWIPTCQPRSHPDAHGLSVVITCWVCGALEQVTVTNEVLLCNRCRTDLTFAQSTLEVRIEQAFHSFCQALHTAANYDQVRYEGVCQARRAVVGIRKHDGAYIASVVRRLAVAKAAGDGLSRILEAEAAMYATLQAVWQAREELLSKFDGPSS